MENQLFMRFPKMAAYFFHQINVFNRVGEGDSYLGIEPEECDREFLISFIQSFQPYFSDNEFITFDDLVLKCRSLIIHAEIEYPHTAPNDGLIWWKLRNVSEPYTKFEFGFEHELPKTYQDGDGLSDKLSDSCVSVLESESETEIYFNQISCILKSVEHLKSENKNHKRKFRKMLHNILRDKPFIEKLLSRRMNGDPNRKEIIKDLNDCPGGPILEFRERLSYELINLLY